jgi:uncharacterized membrane protein
LLHALGNKIECVLWVIIAFVFLIRSLALNDFRKILCGLCFTAFFMFGISDLVEVQTGAWYKPWWLLAWKIACVATMLACLLYYLKKHKLIKPEAVASDDLSA